VAIQVTLPNSEVTLIMRLASVIRSPGYSDHYPVLRVTLITKLAFAITSPGFPANFVQSWVCP